jgi:hypothetical protein
MIEVAPQAVNSWAARLPDGRVKGSTPTGYCQAKGNALAEYPQILIHYAQMPRILESAQELRR